MERDVSDIDQLAAELVLGELVEPGPGGPQDSMPRKRCFRWSLAVMWIVWNPTSTLPISRRNPGERALNTKRLLPKPIDSLRLT